MNRILLLAIVALMFSCKDNKPVSGTFGAAFETANAISLNDAMVAYNSGKDTSFTITGTIENICKHKGCWISFKDANGKEVYFNNNETFVIPANAKGHKATARGKFLKDDKGELSFETTGVVIE